MFIDYSNPDNVVIKHKETINKGKLYSNGKKWWLDVQTASNYYPFDIFDVDASSFIKNILGYSNLGSVVVRSKEDLIKVLDALNKEYDKRFSTNLKSSDFVVGERVLVRSDLLVGKKYGNITCIRNFIPYCNRIVTISKVASYDNTLQIAEDFEGYWWSPEMFIKLHTMSIDTSWLDSSVVTLPKNVSFKAEESKDSTISINNFIKSKKHYQLNFNN